MPAPVPEGPDSIVLNKFSGLRNTIGPERLGNDEFARARNIDIDDIGQVRRRRGYTKVGSGNYHSLYAAAGGIVYVVKDGTLGILNPDYSFIGMSSGIGPDPLAYQQVGPVVYFSSATNSGKISNGTVSPWGESIADFWFSPVVNPLPDLPPTGGRLFGSPPLATVLAYYNGRIYLANRNILWATEMYLYNIVDKTRNFYQFESNINIIGVVTDGLYIGTDDAVYFLSGMFSEFKTNIGYKGGMKRIVVINTGAIPGSLVTLPSELVHPALQANLAAPIDSKNAILFMTKSGLVCGLDGGNTFNLTQTKFLFPDMTAASALFRRQNGVNQYLSVANSGGTPAEAARFGDHLSAQLIRFNGDVG
jgi:hypothetical protein